jgi:hypothetical protein
MPPLIDQFPKTLDEAGECKIIIIQISPLYKREAVEKLK